MFINLVNLALDSTWWESCLNTSKIANYYLRNAVAYLHVILHVLNSVVLRICCARHTRDRTAPLATKRLFCYFVVGVSSSMVKFQLWRFIAIPVGSQQQPVYRTFSLPSVQIWSGYDVRSPVRLATESSIIEIVPAGLQGLHATVRLLSVCLCIVTPEGPAHSQFFLGLACIARIDRYCSVPDGS
jgi:hypothetical protein